MTELPWKKYVTIPVKFTILWYNCIFYWNYELQVDLRTKFGALIPPVQDQGTTNYCWAFASLPAIEFQQAMANKARKPLQLSVQQVIDGVQRQPQEGGSCKAAWAYAKQVGGLQKNDTYRQYDGCVAPSTFDPTKVAAKVKGFVLVPNDEATLAIAASKNLVTVAVKATGDFLRYSGGVFDEPTWDKNGSKPNHNVVVVGFGHDDKHDKDFWRIRNTWGKKWGEEGYGRIVRGKNMLGIVSQKPCFPLIEDVSHFFLFFLIN